MQLPEHPVIPGFHPDPSVCRVGEFYYLVNSSFEYAPGVPIFRSRDLREWTLLGHVLDRPEQLRVAGAGPSGGIFAPTLRHHDGRFWMITTNVSDGPGQLLVTATDPAGPWSDPVRIPGVPGIDPDLAWDEDGTCWISWSGEQPAGEQGILQAQLDTGTGELLTEPKVVWRGTGGKYPEGPHLYRRGSTWYLLIAEGGTERGHMVTIARGPAPDGPFEGCPDNPLLTARSTSRPVQNIGHSDLVERPDGTWAIVFLGVRPDGASPSWHVLGRETFAAEVDWSGDWPRIAGPIEPHGAGAPGGPGVPGVVEHLDGPSLPLSWVAASRHVGEVMVRSDDAWRVRGEGAAAPVFAGRRQEHRYTCTRAELAADGGVAGLEIRIDPFHRVTAELDGNTVRAVATIGGLRVVLGKVEPEGPATLELRTRPASDGSTPHGGPDEIAVRVRDGLGVHEIGRLDGRYLSTEVAGGFTGRFVGVLAGGDVSIRSFTYEGSDDPEAVAARP